MCGSSEENECWKTICIVRRARRSSRPFRAVRSTPNSETAPAVGSMSRITRPRQCRLARAGLAEKPEGGPRPDLHAHTSYGASHRIALSSPAGEGLCEVSSNNCGRRTGHLLHYQSPSTGAVRGRAGGLSEWCGPVDVPGEDARKLLSEVARHSVICRNLAHRRGKLDAFTTSTAIASSAPGSDTREQSRWARSADPVLPPSARSVSLGE